MVALVSKQADVSYDMAENVLKKHKGDAAEALFELAVNISGLSIISEHFENPKISRADDYQCEAVKKQTQEFDDADEVFFVESPTATPFEHIEEIAMSMNNNENYTENHDMDVHDLPRTTLSKEFVSMYDIIESLRNSGAPSDHGLENDEKTIESVSFSSLPGQATCTQQIQTETVAIQTQTNKPDNLNIGVQAGKMNVTFEDHCIQAQFNETKNSSSKNVSTSNQAIQCKLQLTNGNDIVKFDSDHPVVKSILQHIDMSLYQFERHALGTHMESINVQKKSAKLVSKKFKQLIKSLEDQQQQSFATIGRQRKALKLIFFGLIVFMFGMLCLGDSGFTDDFTGKVSIVLPVLAGLALFRYGH